MRRTCFYCSREYRANEVFKCSIYHFTGYHVKTIYICNLCAIEHYHAGEFSEHKE